MSRYIEVGHLKKSVEGLQDCYNGFSDTYDKACFIGLIDEEPTADVVEVVRCKDCRYRDWETNGCERNPCVKPWWEDDYCSYGKR